MKIYCLKKLDGGCAIMWLYTDHTPEEQVAKWPAEERAVYPDPLEYREIAEADVPTDREFRDAWEDSGAAINHNMDKARAIHMDRIRVMRDKELSKLDVAYQRADEIGDTDRKAAVAAEKQKLRDTPQTFDLTSAATPGELKNLWPMGLPKPVG